MDQGGGEIFISYKSERRRAAEHLAESLRLHGYKVWFDYKLVKGRDFARQIDLRIRAAKALVVLWCTRSVQSEWVHEEVDLATSLGILIPVKIEECELPVGNRRKDYVDLTQWDGSPRSHQLDRLLEAIANKVRRDPAPNFRALQEYDATWRRFGALPLKVFALNQPLEATVEARHLPEHSAIAVQTAPSVQEKQTNEDRIGTKGRGSKRAPSLVASKSRERGRPDRAVLRGRFVRLDEAFLLEKANRHHDPRHVFYKAMLETDTYEDYDAAVGNIEVSVETYRTGPISGRTEIRHARKSGWIADAGSFK